MIYGTSPSAAIFNKEPALPNPARCSGCQGLPVQELTHPAALAAIALLGLNDHVLKACFPCFLTGKLSDFAGVFFFPLLLTALADTGLMLLDSAGRRLGTGIRFDYSLTRGKILTALAFTLVFFSLLKMSGSFRAAYVACMAAVGIPASVCPDVTDLAALVMLLPAYLLGMAVIRRAQSRRAEVQL
jgi:hypothetical protein